MKKSLIPLLMLLFAFTGMTKAQDNLSIQVDGQAVDTIKLGVRPANAWKEPFTCTLVNNGPSCMITIIDFTPEGIFELIEPELPFILNQGEDIELKLSATSSSAGTESGQMVILFSSRTAQVWEIMADFYDPVAPDVVEMAYDFSIISSGFSYQGLPSPTTPTTLHNNYTLPFPEIPDGYDAVYKFTVQSDMILNAYIESSSSENKIALYTEDFDGEDGPMASNHYTGLQYHSYGNNISAGPVITNLPITAGKYYLVASSTDGDFLIRINVDDMPCPPTAEHNFNPTPSNNDYGVENNHVTLHWSVPDYATGWRLRFGTTLQMEPYHPQTIIYPEDGSFTREMADSYIVNNLWNNTNYFWCVEFNNDACPDGVSSPTWAFTTHLNVPQNLCAQDYTVFNDEMITLYWNSVVDRSHRYYNVYRDGCLISHTTVNNIGNTIFTDGPLAYNMSGYTYYVTAVYDEGESAPSNTVQVRVSGYGDVNGHVTRMDNSEAVSGATVTLTGNDEFGVSHTYNFTTNDQGYYSGHIYAGSYSGSASCYGYQTLNAPDQGNPVGIPYNQTISPIDYTLVPNNYEIVATPNFTGGGNITGAGTLVYGTTCTLTAVPNEGCSFLYWTNNNTVISNNATYSFTVTQDDNYIAYFTSLEPFNHVVAQYDPDVNDANSPYVKIYWENRASIAEQFDSYLLFRANGDGTGVELLTDTVTQMQFIDYTWLTLNSGSYKYGVCIPTMDTLWSNLIEMPYRTITVSASPSEGGSVTGGGTFDNGTSATLTATVNPNYIFQKWTKNGTTVSYHSTFELTVTEDAEYVAIFAPRQYQITATANPANAGTVTGSGTYTFGSTVTLEATANEGYTFINWTKDNEVVSTEASYSFTATGSGNYIAQFIHNSYSIFVSANPSEGGTVTGEGTYVHGSTATLIATCAENYQFVNWTKDGTEVSTNLTYSFVVTEGGDYVANFELLPLHTITVVQTEGGTIEAPASAYATQTVTVAATSSEPLYRLASLFYYTDNPDDATAVNIQTMQFAMPFADITLSGVFQLFEMGDVNLDGSVNILDVLATLNYILGNDVGFDFELGDMNNDGTIDISDALAINAAILGYRPDCDDVMVTYEVIDGTLYIESDIALAGYQFSLSDEPTSIALEGFSTMGNWTGDRYTLLVYSLSSEREPGCYPVLDLGGGSVTGITMATKEGCSVRGEEGTVGVGSIDEDRYSVYPIPAHDEVTVKGPAIQTVEVFNPLGQLVKRIANVNVDRTVINVSDLSAGSYLFRIHTPNGSLMKNVILE